MTDAQIGLLVVAIYFIIAILYIVIGSITFKPLDGDWEMVCGIPCEKDEECQRGEMVARGFFWPVVLIFVTAIVIPVLVDKLSRYLYYKHHKDEKHSY